MHFASDNAGPVHPQALEAMARANSGHQLSYGAEPLMDTVRNQIRTLFEAPDAAVYLVTTGTAANALALSCLANPWDAIFCSRVAHIEEDECNAPEFYTGGAKLTLVETRNGKMVPEALAAAMDALSGSVHQAQPGPVSITNVTELGTVHSCEEIAALAQIAKARGSRVHLDGARFANAIAALGCTPAEMTWKAGVDAVSFGGTKNGLMGVEAVILFDPAKAREFELRRKRGAHLMSKHRYLAAQMEAYLTEDLWLDSARRANALGQRLAAGIAAQPGARLLHTPDANLMFARWSRAAHKRLFDAGAVYHLTDGTLEGPGEEDITCRLVCDWSIGEDAVDAFLKVLAG
ncbi:MAG: low specificity L-threonine aldolase [Rhodobacterales bacterium]|nr:MAG: low specificity L-threonine aldolase [Rhodobacterales bacterium]